MTGGLRRWGYAACLAILLISLSFRLDGHPLLDPDEGRNGEVAREMALSNDYLLPRLNALPYVDKPVLYFAAAALSIEALGATELAVRLPSLLFALATLGTVWWFGRRAFSAEAGLVAAIAAGATPLMLAFSRTVIFDSALTFFTTLSIAAFYLAGEAAAETAFRPDAPAYPPTRPPASPAWWPAVAWGSMALGVLTKGPIAIALPLLVAVPYLAWRRTWKPLLDPVGVLLFLALLLPWVRAMSVRVPDFLEYVVVTETFQRLTTPALQRTGPWWYFLPILLVGTMPWSILVLGAARRPGAPPNPRIVFLLLWILVPLLFFSLSQSKRPQYLLPLVPAVALLGAAAWTPRGVRFGAASLAILGTAVLLAYPRLPTIIRNVSPGVAAAMPSTAISLGVICLVAAATAFLAHGRSRQLALLALVLPAASIPFISGTLMREIGKDRSAAELAGSITHSLTDATEVVAVQAFPPSLPFYLQRPLTIATDDARELTSNYLLRHATDWIDVPGSPLRPAAWWQEAAIECERPRIFVVRTAAREPWQFLAGRMPVIVTTSRYTAFGPCGLPALAAN